MLRDVGHAYAKKLAEAGDDITYVHYPDLPHGIIQMTPHSKRCLAATEEIARLLGEKLNQPRHVHDRRSLALAEREGS